MKCHRNGNKAKLNYEKRCCGENADRSTTVGVETTSLIENDLHSARESAKLFALDEIHTPVYKAFE